jgi:hypothetical protein
MKPVTILISSACGLGDFLMLESFIRTVDAQRPVILLLPERSLFKDELVRDWQLQQTDILHYGEGCHYDRVAKRWQLFKLGWRSETVFLPFANRLTDLALLAATTARKVYAVSPGPGPGRRLALAVLSLFSRQKQLVFKRHKTDQFQELLKLGGLTAASPETPVPDTVRKHIVLAPGYGSIGHQFKAWPRYHELVSSLLQRLPETEKVVLLGGGANDQAIIGRILEKLGPQPRVKAILDPDYARAKQILSNARAVVANDNGLAHWAGRLGSPVLVLSGPTSPIYTGQQGSRVQTLRRDTTCSPCLHPDNTRPATLPPPRCRNISCTDCMDFATTEVLAVIDRQLGRKS